MISEKQQYIYNMFLKASRKGKPFKYRKNFDNISSDVEFYLARLEIFFNQFPYIKINDFFNAPYEILDSDGYYDLKFYNSMKAKSCYTIYSKNKKLNEDITIDELKQSLIFLTGFCKEHNIHINDYINYKSSVYNEFLLHLKQNKIHLFVLFALNNFEQVLNNIPNDYLQLLFGDLFDNINILRTNYYNSKFKEAIKKAIIKLQ